MRRGRFLVANDNGIPFNGQPENGYTYLQAICRVQRENQGHPGQVPVLQSLKLVVSNCVHNYLYC